MSLRTRLTVIVAVIVAVAVVGGAYAAQLSAHDALQNETDKFLHDRAAEIVSRPPDGNGGPNHWECWFRDPDGYTVVLASPDGSADGNWRPEPRL